MTRLTLPLVVIAALAVPAAARAEVVFSNLNNSSSVSPGYGFNYVAQRFTTGSAGSGLQVDLNLVAMSGTAAYTVELWSANLSGTNVGSLLTTLGSGTTSSTDPTAITSFTKTQNLDAATNYYVLVNTPGPDFIGFPFGPADSATLNSVLVYGNVIPPPASAPNAIGMQVTVATVPEPATTGLAAIAGGLGALATWCGRRRRSNTDDSTIGARRT